MLELCIYLDSLRNSNNYIDSNQLMKIISIGTRDLNKLSISDRLIYNKLISFGLSSDTNYLINILDNFNRNWDERMTHQSNIEKYLNMGDISESDRYYFNKIGCLMYLTQYFNLKVRYFNKSNYYSLLKVGNFQLAYKSFINENNLDLLQIFMKKYKELTKEIETKIIKLIAENNYYKANDCFEKNLKDIEYKEFNDYCTMNNLGFNIDIENNLTFKVYQGVNDVLLSEYKAKYTNLPTEIILDSINQVLHNEIKNYVFKLDYLNTYKILTNNFLHLGAAKVEEVVTNSFDELLRGKIEFSSYDFYVFISTIIKKYVAKYDEYMSRTIDVFNLNKVKKQGDFSTVYKAIVIKAIEIAFSKENYFDVKYTYHFNEDLIAQEQYKKLIMDHFVKKANYHESNMNTSIDDILNFYTEFSEYIDESHIELIKAKVENQKMDFIKSERISNYIEKLKLLSSNYVGVNKQKYEFERLNQTLKDEYKSNSKLFSDSQINKIKAYKKHISDFDQNNLAPNIVYEKPKGLKDAIFYHIDQYYIATFVKEVDSNNLNKKIVIKPFKQEEKVVYESEIETIGRIDGESYRSNCYKCGERIMGEIQLKCPKCQWYICTVCSACGCGYRGRE